MNKKGFTLAEILITLTIIGIVASLAIPSLIQSVQNNQYKTAWKSALSDLNQVNTRLLMDNGGTVNGVFLNDTDLVNKYSSYLSYIKKCPSGQNCWHVANNWYELNGNPRNANYGEGLILSNGNLIGFYQESQTCAYNGNGLPTCGYMYVDINGFKGPNTIGKDIYLVWIQQNKITPAGARDNYVNTCSTLGSG